MNVFKFTSLVISVKNGCFYGVYKRNAVSCEIKNVVTT